MSLHAQFALNLITYAVPKNNALIDKQNKRLLVTKLAFFELDQLFRINKNSWEQRKLGDITYQSGERNVEGLPYESYSVSNKDGFVSQKEQFKYGGLVTSADKSRSIIVEPCTFAYNPARIDIGSIGYQNLGKNVIISPMYEIFKADNNILNDRFLWHWLKTDIFASIVVNNQEGGVRTCFNLPKFFSSFIVISNSINEQEKIGLLFDRLDSLITLHQRKRLFILAKAR